MNIAICDDEKRICTILAEKVREICPDAEIFTYQSGKELLDADVLPDILLLDEPFGDLDPKTLRTVSNSLKRICKEFGTTIVMVSHNTDFIRELSNRAVFIDQGLLKDDTEDVDKLVDDFIGFCHADYLM